VNLARGKDTPLLPYELAGLMSSDEWQHRTETIKEICHRFSAPVVEKIWFLVAAIASVVLPFPLCKLAFRAVFDRNRPDQTFSLGRLASAAVFLGIIFVLWGPITIWKLIGSRKMRLLIKQWQMQDRATTNTGSITVWSVSFPGAFNSCGRITVIMPPETTPSSFHPNAYLPAYVAAPNYFPGGPPVGMNDTHPFVVAYNGPEYGHPSTDERRMLSSPAFHDVKV